MLFTLLMTAPFSMAQAERTEFKSKSKKADEQLFDYAFGWKLCVMEWQEFVKYIKKAEKTRKKYQVLSYLREDNPSKEHTALLEANREEIERMFDVFTISQTLAEGDKEYCEKVLKKEGLFGKQ